MRVKWWLQSQRNGHYTLDPIRLRMLKMPACTCGWGGDYSGRETPVPIPNTVVKPFSSDDTAGAALWENRTLPLHPPVEAGVFMYHIPLHLRNSPSRQRTTM